MQYSYRGLTMGAFHLVYKTEEETEQLMHQSYLPSEEYTTALHWAL